MLFRTSVSLVITLAAVAVAAACGGGGDSSTDTPTGTADVSVTPAAQATGSPTQTRDPQATPSIFVEPSRSLPPATHNGLGVFEAITFLEQELHGAAPTSVDCDSFDATAGIIDCTSKGYGTIALDPIPSGSADWQCHALLTPDGVLFGANCIGTRISFIYGLQD